jgi:ferritin-like metal-binding protein YciE
VKENLLQKLYIDELKDLYSAENQLLKALPKMAGASTAPKLRAGFDKHLKQTKQHVARLEKIFKSMKEGPHGKHCSGMEGLIKEGSELIAEDPDPEQLDAGLIAAAQHVEHYEMAGYGCVHTYAKLLGEKQAASILAQTYREEKETDKSLSQLAKSINVEAMDAEDEDK